MNEDRGLICPACGCRHFTVFRTRQQTGRVYRLRVCRNCGRRIPSYEYLAGEGPRKVNGEALDHHPAP